MDITPVISPDKKIIQSYSEEYFKVNNEKFFSNLIVIYNEVIAWNVDNYEEFKIADLDIIKNKDVEILLIGCGKISKSINPEIKYAFKEINIEIMNTGAACRTYNILLAEGRLVGAALILPE